MSEFGYPAKFPRVLRRYPAVLRRRLRGGTAGIGTVRAPAEIG